MTQQGERKQKGKDAVSATGKDDSRSNKDAAQDNQEDELEAEQESAAAMDADVPQPSDADSTTEGQPS